MRKLIVLAALAVAVSASSEAQIINVIDYATVDGGGSRTANPLLANQVCAVVTLTGLDGGVDGGSFTVTLYPVDPLNPSVPAGPAQSEVFTSPTAPDAGYELCDINGAGAWRVLYQTGGYNPLWTGVTLSMVGTIAGPLGPTGPTGPTGPSGGGGISDGGLYVNGPLTVDGGVDVLVGCYSTPAGCTVCDDGQNLVLSPLPDGGVVVAKGGVYSDGGIQASSLDAGSLDIHGTASVGCLTTTSNCGGVSILTGAMSASDVFNLFELEFANSYSISQTTLGGGATFTAVDGGHSAFVGGLSADFIDAGIVQAAFLDAGCIGLGGVVDCSWPSGAVQSNYFDGGVIIDAGGMPAGLTVYGGILAYSLDAGTVNSATLTAGFEDAGQVDAVLGVFGALDAGVLNAATITATAETVTSLTATAESAGFLDAGIVQAAFLDAGQVDTGLLVCAEIDAGTVNAVVETVGFLDAGQVDAKLAVLSAIDAGAINALTETAGFLDAGQVDATLGVFGAIDAGTINATTETVSSLTTTAESAGFLDAGIVQAAFLDAGQVDTGLLVCAELDAGAINAVTETVGFLDAGQVDSTLAVLGAIDAGTMNTVTETATAITSSFLDAGCIGLGGVVDCSWPAGGTQSNYFDGGVVIDAGGMPLGLVVYGGVQAYSLDAGSINAATETVGFLDAGQLDAVLAVIGAIDAGAENVITITSVTATAITLTASMIDAGVVQAAFLDAGQIDTGLLVCSALDAGAVNAVVETAGFMDAGQVDTGLLVAGAIDAGVIAAVRETDGFVDAGQVDATLLVCGAIDAGVVMATFESLGLLDAGEICLQGVCETTWPSGGAQSNYFDGGVLMDGGSNLFTELTVIGGESVSGSLTASGTVTGSTFTSDVVQNNVGFGCSFAGCQYSLDPSGFAYMAEADGGTRYVTADGGQAYFTGGNLFGLIVDGGGTNYVELQGGNVTATGTLSVSSNIGQTNGTVFLNNGTNNSISMSGGTTAINGNTASIMGAAGTSEFQCVNGSCGMLASDPLTLGASELAFGNDAGWIEGSQPGLITMVGADGVANVVQVGNYQITGLPNNGYWAIYAGGVTPGSGNFAFLGDLAGTVSYLNAASNVYMTIGDGVIVNANAGGAAVTGTLGVSGLSTLTGGVEINSANTVFWLNDAGVGPGIQPGLIAIRGADGQSNVAYMGNLQTSGHVPGPAGFAIYSAQSAAEPGSANWSFFTDDGGIDTAISGSSTACLNIGSTYGFCCNGTNCIAGAQTGTPSVAISAQAYSATPASGAGYQAGGVTYFNDAGVAGTLYVTEAFPSVACSTTGTALPLHFSATPACNCSVSETGTVAVSECVFSAVSSTSVTVKVNTVTDCTGVTVTCLGAH